MAKIGFVMGRAHSGKSALVYEQYAKDTAHFSMEKYLFLVPDQMTLAVQKELLKKKENDSLYRTMVIGFTRLAYRLYEEKNVSLPIVLDEIGKNLLLQKALFDLEKEGSLKLFKNSSGKTGFIRSLSALIREMTEYGVTDDALIEGISRIGGNPTLKNKITDILQIRAAYLRLKGQSYISAEDLLCGAAGLVEGSELIKDVNIVIDGFSAFTPIQYEVLSGMCISAKSVTFVLDMDEKTLLGSHKEDSLFYECYKTYENICTRAEKLGIMPEKPVFCNNVHYDNAPALKYLEAGYEQSVLPYGKQAEEILIFSAGDPSSEIDAVLEEIMKLTAGKTPLHYREIAVITTNEDSYAEIIEEKFGLAGVPYFTDHKKGLFHNPGIEGMLAAISACENDLSYESVFRYLRSGLFEQTRETDMLDIYVRAMGIRGINAYKGSFAARKRRPDRLGEEDIAALDEYKGKVLGSLFGLYKKIKKPLIQDKISALYDWMAETFVSDVLEEKKKELDEKGEALLAWEYGQIYELMNMMLTQVSEVLKDETADEHELYRLLESCFEQKGVGIIPNLLDAVTIGDLKRSRIADVKALFIIGMNEGTFPGGVEDTGLLSDADRECLVNASDAITLSETEKEQQSLIRYFVYRGLAKPKERLYLSYSMSGEDQKKIFPSYVLRQVKKILPQIKEKEVKTTLYHKRQGLLALADPAGFGLDGDEHARLLKYYSENVESMRDIDMITNAKKIDKKVGEVIDPDNALALFGGGGKCIKPAISCSRLETFATCKLRHFLNYGLDIMPRQEYEIKAPDIGNIYHDALDRIFKTAKEENKKVTGLDEEGMEKRVTDALDAALENARFDMSAAGSKNSQIYRQMRDTLILNMKIIINQLSSGNMQPFGTEIVFGKDSARPAYDVEDSPFVINGKVDRVDSSEAEGGEVFRIIDYKSGSTKFDKKRISEGIQLQLLLYSAAFKNTESRLKGRDVTLGGAYYYHINDGFLELEPSNVKDENGRKLSESDLKDLVWEKTLMANRLNGISASEKDILSVMDSGVARRRDGESYRSCVIDGLGIKKDNSFLSTSLVCSGEEMEDVLCFAEDKMAELGQGILGGDAKADPFKEGEKTACTYCPYSGKCGFDSQLGGKYRELKNVLFDE